MICLLVRHGKTPGNENGIYLGCKIDESLSDSGREAVSQCRIYNDLLEGRRLRVFSSPMKRARETAGILFGEETNIIEEITEIDFGDFEGKNYQQLNGNEDYQRWIDSGGTVTFPGGESMEEYGKRCRSGLDKIINQTADDEVAVVVCHGGTIMALLCGLTGKNYFDFQIGNLEGYWLEFRTKDGTISDLSYNRITGRSDS